jgi:hypothetical protein
MNRTIGLVTALLGCSAFAVGCSSAGGTPGATAPRSAAAQPMSAQAYRHLLQSVSHQEDAAHRAVDHLLHATKVTVMRKGFLDFAADQQRVSEELSSVTPPRDATEANAALARALADNAGAVRQVAAQLAHAHTPKQAMTIVSSARGAQRAGQEIDAAVGRLRKLGYTAGS